MARTNLRWSPAGKRSKYGNKKVQADGYTFDSQAEYRHYLELKWRKSVGEICDLKIHPRYKIVVSDQLICTYVADFEYKDQQLKQHIIDVKGVETGIFKLKRKLMRIVNGLEIELVKY